MPGRAAACHQSAVFCGGLPAASPRLPPPPRLRSLRCGVERAPCSLALLQRRRHRGGGGGGPCACACRAPGQRRRAACVCAKQGCRRAIMWQSLWWPPGNHMAIICGKHMWQSLWWRLLLRRRQAGGRAVLSWSFALGACVLPHASSAAAAVCMAADDAWRPPCS